MIKQGTKVLESREIRTAMQTLREGAPQREVLVEITKYDGNKKEPRWMDLQPSTAFIRPWFLYPMLMTSKRQVRNSVSCSRRHFRRTLHTSAWGFWKNVLLSGVRRGAAGGPHRAEGSGPLG